MIITGGKDLKDPKNNANVKYDVKEALTTLPKDDILQLDKDVSRTYFPAYLAYAELRDDPREKTEEETSRMKKLLEESDQQKEAVRNILLGYMNIDRQVGYVQGFNSIVAALVYINHIAYEEYNRKGLNNETFLLTEEDLFFTFYGLMTIVGWRRNFSNGMDDIQRLCDEFKVRMDREDPILAKKFFKNQVRHPSNFADTSGGVLRIVLLDDLYAHHADGAGRQDT